LVLHTVSGPFLTELDSRAAIKGSRDPLGLQTIWTRFGRRVVGNLTTQTTSVRDFTTLLLGYHFVEEVVGADRPGEDVEVFLQWEQLAAYARATEKRSFRGTDRVHKNLAEGPKVTLSAEPAHQILGNQKIYGLWGLYTVPARASGWVQGDPPRLTSAASDLVRREYLPALTAQRLDGGAPIRKLLGRPVAKIDIHGREERIVQAIAHLLRPQLSTRERETYRQHLEEGGPDDRTAGLQRRLAGLLEGTLDDAGFSWDSPTLDGLARRAASETGVEAERLAAALDDIRVCESLLAPVTMLFSWLLGQDGQKIEALATVIRKECGSPFRSVDPAIRRLEPEFAVAAGGDPEVGRRWIAIAEALLGGDYASTVKLLLLQNAFVMQARAGAAPWAVEEDGVLGIRFRDETGRLPKRGELRSLWRFSYFLGSLREIAQGIRRRGS
jgi:hypothetical protein